MPQQKNLYFKFILSYLILYDCCLDRYLIDFNADNIRQNINFYLLKTHPSFCIVKIDAKIGIIYYADNETQNNNKKRGLDFSYMSWDEAPTC